MSKKLASNFLRKIYRPVSPLKRQTLFEREHDRKMRVYYKKLSRGFTLIEILVVVGIIAILATIVLVAVNPARQFKLARDSQRVSNVNALLNAIHQNMAEHRGIFTCSGLVRDLPASMLRIQSTSTPGYSGDLAGCVVPDYISALPFDPSAAGAHYASTTDYDTGYYISKDGSGRMTLFANGELESSISVTR